MATLPEIKNVPRSQVHERVRRMLQETDADGNYVVGSIECLEQPDGRYTLRPRNSRRRRRRR